MKRIIQEPYECLLASLCMLTGRNYTTARSTFKHTFGKEWPNATAFEICDFAVRHFGIAIDPADLDCRTPPTLCTHEGNRIALIRYPLVFHLHAVYVTAANEVYDPFPTEPIDNYDTIRFQIVKEIKR